MILRPSSLLRHPSITWSKEEPPAQRKWMKCPSAASSAVLPTPFTPLSETKRLCLGNGEMNGWLQVHFAQRSRRKQKRWKNTMVSYGFRGFPLVAMIFYSGNHGFLVVGAVSFALVHALTSACTWSAKDPPGDTKTPWSMNPVRLDLLGGFQLQNIQR